MLWWCCFRVLITFMVLWVVLLVWCVCVDFNFICLEHLFFGLIFFLQGVLVGYLMWLFWDFFPQGILMLGFE